MKSSISQDVIRIQFDYLIKRVIESTVKDYHRKIRKRSKHEVLFTDLPQASLNQMGNVDEYEIDRTSFKINDTELVNISHERLADALNEISNRKRAIVLMSYYLDVSDKEIAKALKIHPSTSYRNRQRALTEIRRIMQEERRYECECS